VNDNNDSQVDEEDQENLQQMAALLAQQQDNNDNNNNLMMRRRQRRNNDNDEWREANNNNDDSDIKEDDDAKLEDGTPLTAAVEDDGTAMYDFDYNDSSASVAGDGDDAVYYSLAETTAPAESLFDRRERLDVKKPGPFFTNSQNNFFLDKVRENAA
jgi:hypothetical protein